MHCTIQQVGLIPSEPHPQKPSFPHGEKTDNQGECNKHLHWTVDNIQQEVRQFSSRPWGIYRVKLVRCVPAENQQVASACDTTLALCALDCCINFIFQVILTIIWAQSDKSLNNSDIIIIICLNTMTTTTLVLYNTLHQQMLKCFTTMQHYLCHVTVEMLKKEYRN